MANRFDVYEVEVYIHKIAHVKGKVGSLDGTWNVVHFTFVANVIFTNQDLRSLGN